MPLLGYGTIFHMLEMDWLSFIFKGDVASLSIIRRWWFMDRYYLSIKPWHTYFNVKDEFSIIILVLVKLPSIPRNYGLNTLCKILETYLGILFLSMIVIKANSGIYVSYILV